MSVIAISSRDIIKLLHYAFSEHFDTITILTGKDNLEIFGLDKSSCIAGQLELEIDKLERYTCDHLTSFSVINEDFTNFLRYSTSRFIPSFNSLHLHIHDDHMDMAIMSPDKYTLRRRCPFAVDGIESLPPIVSFENEPNFVIKDINLLRLVYENLKEKDWSGIILEIDTEEIVFSSLEGIPILEINETGFGKRSTVLSAYTIDVVSKVYDLTSIENLEISISEGKLTQFRYTFEGGILRYVAPSSSEQ